MRVVFDTNIVISGRLWSGAPKRVLTLADQGQVMSLITEVMIDELKDVISRPKFELRLKKLNLTADELVASHLKSTHVIEANPLTSSVSPDPDDDHIIACSVSGKAAYLVSGDPHLLDLRRYGEILIINAYEFLEIFEGDG